MIYEEESLMLVWDKFKLKNAKKSEAYQRAMTAY